MFSWNPLTASNSIFDNNKDGSSPSSSSPSNNKNKKTSSSSTALSLHAMSDSDLTSLLVSLNNNNNNNNNNDNTIAEQHHHDMMMTTTICQVPSSSSDDSICSTSAESNNSNSVSRARSPSQDHHHQQQQQHQTIEQGEHDDDIFNAANSSLNEQNNNNISGSNALPLLQCHLRNINNSSKSCFSSTIPSSASSVCGISTPPLSFSASPAPSISAAPSMKALSKDTAHARAFVPRGTTNSIPLQSNNNEAATTKPTTKITTINQARIEGLNTRHFVTRVANSKYNLHSLLPEQAGLLTVPFVTQELFDKMIVMMMNREDHFKMQNSNNNENTSSSSSTSTSTTKLFFGQGPLVPNENVYRLLCMAVAGVNPLSIKILDPPPPPKHVSNPKILTKPPLVLVEVADQDAQKVIASIHKRVIFDQAAFHVATTQEQVRLLHNYSKMLSVNPTARFQHRPYTAVTVTRASPKSHPKGAPPLYDNEFNPLCSCEKCNETFSKTVVASESDFNNSFLFSEYLTDKIAFNTAENPHPLFFLRTHAFVDKSELVTEVKQKLYSDVSDVWIHKCNENARQKWNQYRDLVVPAESSLCKNCSVTNNDNMHQQQQQQQQQNQQQRSSAMMNVMMNRHQMLPPPPPPPPAFNHHHLQQIQQQPRYPFVVMNNNNNNFSSLPPPPPPPPHYCGQMMFGQQQQQRAF